MLYSASPITLVNTPPPQSLPIYNLLYAEFWQEIHNFNGTSDDVIEDDVIENEEILKLFLPILRANFTVLDSYIYTHQPPLDLRISVFGGLQDPHLLIMILIMS